MSASSSTSSRPLNLAEYYLLACLDEGGKFYAEHHTIRLGIAGATLTELARRGYLYVTQNLVIVNSQQKTELEEPLNKILDILIAAPENLDAEQWINRFARPGLSSEIVASLVRREELEVNKKRLLGIFPRTRYLTADSYIRTDLYVRLRTAVLGNNGTLDSTTGPLIQILDTTKVLSKIFPEVNPREVRNRLNAYLSSAAEHDRAVIETLQAIENAITEALIATRG